MRDFRDAKAMAFSLRDALQVKAVQTTHSECLELIAKAFGYDNWNILSAKIEASQSPAPDAAAVAPVAVNDQAAQKTLHCSFCGKSQHDVHSLIAGPAVFVCDECVGHPRRPRCLGADEDEPRERAGRWRGVRLGSRPAHRGGGGLRRAQSRSRASAPPFAGRRTGVGRAKRGSGADLAFGGSLEKQDEARAAHIEQDAQRALKLYEGLSRIATATLEERRTS